MKRERRKCSNRGNKIQKNFKDNVKKKNHRKLLIITLIVIDILPLN